MRKRSVIIAAACAAALGVANLASAGPASRVVASASGDYELSGPAAGSFFVIDPFRWKVQLLANGNARGHYKYTQVRDGVQLDVSGSLHCATIIGNHVWVGGLIEESSRASLVGLDMWFQAQDNGKGKTDPDMSSTIGAGAAGAAQKYCDDHPAVLFPFLLERGDLKVRD